METLSEVIVIDIEPIRFFGVSHPLTIDETEPHSFMLFPQMLSQGVETRSAEVALRAAKVAAAFFSGLLTNSAARLTHIEYGEVFGALFVCRCDRHNR